MTYELHFLPDVEEDAISGYVWYEEKAQGLGEEFLRTFYACASKIQRNPFFASEVYREFRRSLLRRFPYAIYYRVRGDEVIVFGLFHCARDPRSITSKLRDRGEHESI